jgi:hypothetical protein
MSPMSSTRLGLGVKAWLLPNYLFLITFLYERPFTLAKINAAHI